MLVGHYLMPSIMLGYLAYDTAYTLTFGPGGFQRYSIVAHHVVVMACCVVGIGWGVNGYYAAAMVSLSESTTPLLSAIQMFRLVPGGQLSSRYVALGLALCAQYLVCRVVLCTKVMVSMTTEMLEYGAQHGGLPWWCVAAVGAFGCLCALNYMWFIKLAANAAKRLAARDKPRQHLLLRETSKDRAKYT